MENMDLVTGASGLLGANLVRGLCAKGRHVRILVRKTSKIQHLDDLPNLEKVEGDITDYDSLVTAMRGVEYVYHCAARVTVQQKITAPIWQTNVVGTENVILAAKATGIGRLVHCSSVDALGLPTDDQPVNEETLWNWDHLGLDNAYARTKYESHQRVLQAAVTGLDSVLVCPGYMFGAFDIHPSSGQMILDLAKRVIVPIPLGGNNFVDVEDVVEGMISAACQGSSGETYILGNCNLTYDQIFTCISSILGKRFTKLRLSQGSLNFLADSLLGWEKLSGREYSINSTLIRLGNVQHYYDSSKAIRALNFPQRPVENAIERAIFWFKQQGRL